MHTAAIIGWIFGMVTSGIMVAQRLIHAAETWSERWH